MARFAQYNLPPLLSHSIKFNWIELQQLEWYYNISITLPLFKLHAFNSRSVIDGMKPGVTDAVWLNEVELSEERTERRKERVLTSEMTGGNEWGARLHSLIHSIHWMWWSESNAAWIQSPIEESKAQFMPQFNLHFIPLRRCGIEVNWMQAMNEGWMSDQFQSIYIHSVKRMN